MNTGDKVASALQPINAAVQNRGLWRSICSQAVMKRGQDFPTWDFEGKVAVYELFEDNVKWKFM